MHFYLSNGLGDSIDDPSPEEMRGFLESVDASDEEHGAAWLSTDDEHSLEWNGDGRLVWSTPGHKGPRHLKNVTRERTLELWAALAQGDTAQVERQPWAAGNGFVRSPEWERELAAQQAREDREFFELIGDEDPSRRCAADGCGRGQTRFSLLCRLHHFAMVKGRPYTPSD